MDNKAVASYGYLLGNTLNKLIASAIVSVFVALACSAALSPWFLLLLLTPVGIFVYIKRSGCSKPLLITSRYLILGDRIMYFGTVTRASLDKEKQTLTIIADKGRSLTIAADKFPTNARKPDKIRINRSAKFDKVSERIMARLRVVSPDLDLS